MQETIHFLQILDNKIKRSHTTSTKNSASQQIKEKYYFKRNNKFPFAKAIDFTQDKFSHFPKWLTNKDGFSDFMYKNYQSKLLSIPKICQKLNRASDEKYFVSLFLDQVEIFKNLPSILNDIILSNITTRYFKPGQIIHNENSNAEFMGVIFLGSVQYTQGKQLIIREKNQIILSEAFYQRKHPTITCRQESVILVLDKGVYKIIQNKLKQQIQSKERDQISDLLKSVFFSELHLKDKRAKTFYSQFKIQFYFKDQPICYANEQANNFYLLYKGGVIEENHIYIRQHNKWPLPDHKWEVRAVYNSYNKSNLLKRFDFFGDQEIISHSKFKSKFMSNTSTILFTIPKDKFIGLMNNEDMKRLKKYRSEHVDINYHQFEKNIREKVRSVSQKKKIIHKAIDTSFHNKNVFTPRKVSLIANFQNQMLSKQFFADHVSSKEQKKVNE